jgi:hypothetical protein
MDKSSEGYLQASVTTSRKESSMTVRKESVMNSALASGGVASISGGGGGVLGTQAALLGTSDLQVPILLCFFQGCGSGLI